jgi:hypothetical protein
VHSSQPCLVQRICRQLDLMRPAVLPLHGIMHKQQPR